jgi:fibrillarin-like pre-rRNA processing protein
LATRSLAPGTSVYGEDIVKTADAEYRVWDPFRSKLAAAILNGLSEVPIKSGKSVLYLGAASGTTASHVSDIVGAHGRVYCVEFAQRSFRDLVNNACKNRNNMIPIFADARLPSHYRNMVPEVDTVYSDVAQPDQARILAENLRAYLGKEGTFLMAIKARSVDVSKEPGTIFRQERTIIEEKGYQVLQMVRLEPFEADHCMILGTGDQKKHGK